MNQSHETVTTKHISFRWDGKQLMVTTQQEQLQLSAPEAMALLSLLFQHKAEIFAVMHQLELPDRAVESASEQTSTTARLRAIRWLPGGNRAKGQEKGSSGSSGSEP